MKIKIDRIMIDNTIKMIRRGQEKYYNLKRIISKYKMR
jgi:hypothetical protein